MIVHRNSGTSAVLIGYAGVYDAAGRLTSVTESPSGAVTSYTYDDAGRVLTETRTGTRPYSGTYTYDRAGRRLSAVVVTNGTTTHNGTYSYDGAGRLTQVVDTATSTTEVYAWNADGTLASSPGPGYTRNYEYDEESRLVKIKRGTTLAYEYGYGYDGGRRWRKDHLNSVWTWFPCGVACEAGELVEQQSDLTGATWATTARYLRAGAGCGGHLLRRNSEYHHFDIFGSTGLITGASATTIGTRVCDRFFVQRYSSGTMQTLWFSSIEHAADDDLIGACYYLPERALSVALRCLVDQINPNDCEPAPDSDMLNHRKCTGERLAQCQRDCSRAGGAMKKCCEVYHIKPPRKPWERPREVGVHTDACSCTVPVLPT